MLQRFTITISLEVSRDKQTLSVAMLYMVIVLFVLKPTKTPATELIDGVEISCDRSDPWRGSSSVPCFCGDGEKPFVQRGSDLNSFVLFIQILTGACAAGWKETLKCVV